MPVTPLGDLPQSVLYSSPDLCSMEAIQHGKVTIVVLIVIITITITILMMISMARCTVKSSHLKLIICKLLIARAVETEQVSCRAQGHLCLDQGGLLVLFGQHGHD